MKFFANITANNEIGHTPHIRHHLSKLDKKKRVLVEVKNAFSKRTLDQNALMWVWFTIIGDYCGYSEEEVHIVVKGLYCPKKRLKIGKISYTVPKGTSELSVGEMVQLMLHIQVMASGLGISLPSPEQYRSGIDSAMLLVD